MKIDVLALKSLTPLPNATEITPAIQSVFSQLEQVKRRSYDQRICEIEHDTFSPLIFASTSGLGKTANNYILS